MEDHFSSNCIFPHAWMELANYGVGLFGVILN